MNNTAAWHAPWQRLRALRAERARTALAEAESAASAAAAVVDQRLGAIDAGRRRLAALAQGWSGPACAAWPRWGQALASWRETLLDRLERDEYALADEEHALEQARDRVQQRRAELARALAREEAVQCLLDEHRRGARRQQERRAEREQDDAACAPAGPWLSEGRM